MLSFKSMRKFNSNIYVVEFDPDKYPSQLSFGSKGKLEPLSSIGHSWYEKNGYKEVAKINLGFFGVFTTGVSEHLGLSLHDSGFMQGNPSGYGAECYLTKDNEFKIEQMSLTKANSIKTQVKWGGSLSYSLIIDGKKNFIAKEHYSHFSEYHPRTLVGQKSDKTMVLVVVDGRSSASKGLTGEQSAQLMLELGCVNAINADGGGSTQMMVKGKSGMQTVNHPSDGKERSVGSALIVFSKEDVVVENKSPIKDAPIAGLIDKIIALDDGHGEETAGKRTPKFSDGTFMKENHFNKAVVQYLDGYLTYNGFKTLLVAPTDVDTPLKTRTDLANNTIKNKYNRRADLYVSVHANAITGTWDNKGAKGVETFYWLGSVEGKKIAETMLKWLLKGTPQVNRGAKTANFHVLRETNMTAVLAECAFMDSLEEAKLLLKDSFRRECAKEMAQAICEYYSVSFKDPDKTEVEDGKEYITYTVVSGDYLYKIAEKFETTYQKIKELNNMTTNIINVGQVLKVKEKEKVSEPPKAEEPKQPEVPKESWEVLLGRDAVKYLHEQDILNNPEHYHDKMNETAPHWLVFELISRLHKEMKK